MDALCRLCMNVCDLIPVLKKNRTNVQYNSDSYEVIVKKIDFCLGFKVSYEDDLTKSICLPCLSSLNTFYEYKKRSIGVQEFLKKYRFQDTLQDDFKQEVTSTDQVEVSDLQIEIKESRSPVKQAPLVANSPRAVEPDFVPGLLVEVRKEARFECSICGEMLKSEHAREAHNNLNHAPKDVFRCEFCPKVCKTSSGLKKHIHHTHHSEKKSNKETEISDHSSSDSPIFRPRFRSRSRSRTYSTSTEKSSTSVTQEDQEKSRKKAPQKIIARRGEGPIKVGSPKHNSPKKTVVPPEETVQKKSTGESSKKIHDPYHKFLEKFKGELKEVRVVLERFDDTAYKKTNSAINISGSSVVQERDTNIQDSFGSPPHLTSISAPNIGNGILKAIDDKKTNADIDKRLNSPPPFQRTRKKAIVFHYEDEDEDFYSDDVDDPPYNPTYSTSKDYLVDVEVVEEMDDDSFDGSIIYDTEIGPIKNLVIEKAPSGEKQTTIVPSNKSSPTESSVKKDIVKIKPDNIVANNKKRKANSDDPVTLFSRKLMIFNLKMADHTDLPFRVCLKYSDNVSLTNKSVTKMVPHDTVKEDTGGEDLGKKLNKMLSKDIQVWLSEMYSKFNEEDCPFMVEDEMELEVTEVDNEETMENVDSVKNETIDKTASLVPIMMNQPIEQPEILNPENSIQQSDSEHMPFIRVKNPQELGIDFPPTVTINEIILHHEHTYAQY